MQYIVLKKYKKVNDSIHPLNANVPFEMIQHVQRLIHKTNRFRD